ncbi:VRR-NUC domain-containing protein [Cubamyces menziesii]|nr:VRR-NUC domain-containing protein [Cubamyces menziesii]
MVLGSPSASIVNKLVFWVPDSEDFSPAERSSTDTTTADNQDGENAVHDDTSMYVKVFEEMLKEVLDGEAKLFVEEELNCFMKYHRLPYPAKYLFCRLCLRKTNRWHRLSKLKYQSELGDGILDAINILCGRPSEDVKSVVDDMVPIVPDLLPTFRLPDEPQIKPDPDAEPPALPEVAVPMEPEVKPQVKDVKPSLKPKPAVPTPYPVIQKEGYEIIDLTFDEDEDTDVDKRVDQESPVAGPSNSPVYEPPPPTCAKRPPDFSVFADDEERADLLDLLDCLSNDELNDIAKQLKLKLKAKKRDVVIDAILRTSSTQGTLGFPIVSSRKRKEKPLVQSTLPFGNKAKPLVQTVLPFRPREPYRTQQDRVYDMVMNKLQKCVRLNADVVELFQRANLVFFRSTQYTPELLTPALLSRAKKRAYAPYPYARTRDIWRTRDDLLAYEAALKAEAEVDALLENASGAGAWARGRSTISGSRTPAVGGRTAPMTPATKRRRVTETPTSVRGEAEEEEEEESMRVKNARLVVRVLESVLPHWRALVAQNAETEDDDGRRKALQRFECGMSSVVPARRRNAHINCLLGHVLTRVVCKGAYALGILHEYERELELLDELLAQTRWRRGRRGRWHERRALLLMKHLRSSQRGSGNIFINVDEDDGGDAGDDTPANAATRTADERALEGVIAALCDLDTHIIFRPMLERRLTRLEKWLNVPQEERHECAARLAAAVKVFIEGERVDRRLHLDEAGRVVNSTAPESGTDGKAGGGGVRELKWANRRETSPRKRGAEAKPEKTGGKSVWKGRDGEEVTVETFALQYYEAQHGCKGYHCEGRIVTTLFGQLFWDVIFAPIPGAFETRYQAAPLDLAEDTFYYARQALADARIAEIEAGRAAEILERTYDAHTGVLCVGVRWDLFPKEDLVALVKCMDARALAVICRLMCEDYAGRTGGVPDLIVWNEEAGWAKFVEVKGPGDSLQENQKVWIDVLLQAGMPVEVCHVYEAGSTPKQAKTKAAAKAKGKSKGKGKTPVKTPRGRKRKRAASSSDSGSERNVESEDEEEVDYSQLDRRHSEDEVEVEVSPTKRQRQSARNAG